MSKRAVALRHLETVLKSGREHLARRPPPEASQRPVVEQAVDALHLLLGIKFTRIIFDPLFEHALQTGEKCIFLGREDVNRRKIVADQFEIIRRLHRPLSDRKSVIGIQINRPQKPSLGRDEIPCGASLPFNTQISAHKAVGQNLLELGFSNSKFQLRHELGPPQTRVIIQKVDNLINVAHLSNPLNRTLLAYYNTESDTRAPDSKYFSPVDRPI